MIKLIGSSDFYNLASCNVSIYQFVTNDEDYSVIILQMVKLYTDRNLTVESTSFDGKPESLGISDS